MTQAVIKQPSEDRLYDLPMGLDDGRTIASVGSVAGVAKGLVTETTALSVSASAYSDSVVQLRISGGTDGEVYLVTVTCTDDVGDTVEAEAELHLLELEFVSPSDGEATTYIEPSEYIKRFGIDETVDLTDENGSGKIDRDRLYAALADAAAEIDGYVASRYETPLSVTPPVVTRIAGDIARARLHSMGEMPNVVAGALADARRILRDIQKGTFKLSSGTALDTPSSAPSWVESSNQPFRDDDDKLDEF